MRTSDLQTPTPKTRRSEDASSRDSHQNLRTRASRLHSFSRRREDANCIASELHRTTCRREFQSFNASNRFSPQPAVNGCLLCRPCRRMKATRCKGVKVWDKTHFASLGIWNYFWACCMPKHSRFDRHCSLGRFPDSHGALGAMGGSKGLGLSLNTCRLAREKCDRC